MCFACEGLPSPQNNPCGLCGRLADSIHVLPVDDLRLHAETLHCWCGPRQDDDEPRVIIHNSVDRREDHETGKRAAQ
jgi:hypothetical protein